MPDYQNDLFGESDYDTAPSNNNISSKIITFGTKYKGQPIEVLANDPSYCEFLLNKPWFKKDHFAIYQFVINNFIVPDDTPEHNALQKLFLKKEFCFALAKLCNWKPMKKASCIRSLDNYLRKINPLKYTNYHLYQEKFEDAQSQKEYLNEAVFVENGIEYIDYETPLFSLEFKFEQDGWDVIIQNICSFVQDDCIANKVCYKNTNKIAVEIKPSIDEKYPGILRQMKAAKDYPDYKCLVYKNISSTRTTLEEVKQCFATENFKVFSIAEIENAQKEL